MNTPQDASTFASTIIPSTSSERTSFSLSSPTRMNIDRLVCENPLAYLHLARQAYQNQIIDYTCRFSRQEFLDNRLADEQVAEVKFREHPFSVYMHVTQNPAEARRVLYVRESRTANGQEQAIIQPEGCLARLFVRSVTRPIDGQEARNASRRSISEFGFAKALDLIIQYTEESRTQDLLDLKFVGTGKMDNRPTFVFERRLPKKENDFWPDALLIFHMDQEWNLPVACYSYADSAGTQLLGKYLYTDVNLNVGLSATDFDPLSYGL